MACSEFIIKLPLKIKCHFPQEKIPATELIKINLKKLG